MLWHTRLGTALFLRAPWRQASPLQVLVARWRVGSPRPRCPRMWELHPRMRELHPRMWELHPRMWELHPRMWAGATPLLGRRHPCSARCPQAEVEVRPSRGPCRRQCTKQRYGAPRRASQACGASPVSRRREISTWRARYGPKCSRRVSPQQQRLRLFPALPAQLQVCNPAQRCAICPGSTSEGDFHGWSKRIASTTAYVTN